MDRYITKRQLIARRQKKLRLRWPLLMLSVAIISSTAFFVYERQQSPLKSNLFSTFYSRITTWMAERRGHLATKAVTVQAKQVAAAQRDVEPQIHYEFYTALPNMQGVTPRVKPSDVDKPPSLKPNEMIADADVLEQELSDAVQQSGKQ